MNDQDWIDAYLAGSLDAGDTRHFEDRLASEPPLRERLQGQKFTIHALERQWLRRQMTSGATFFRNSVIALSAIIAGGLGYYFAGQAVKPSNESAVPQKKTSPLPVPEVALTDFSENKIPLSKIEPGPAPLRERLLTSDTISSYRQAKKAPVAIVRAAPEPIAEIKPAPVYEEVKPEIFYINNHRDTSVQTAKGLTIQMPADILVYTDGKIPDSLIRLDVFYYSDYYMMWQEKVNTTTDDQRLLTSGGSCKISAMSNGREVKPAAGKSYTLQFPGLQDSRMKTFYGDRDSAGFVAWKEDSPDPGITLPKRTAKVDSTFLRDDYLFESALTDNIPVKDLQTGTVVIDVIRKNADLMEYFDVFGDLPDDMIAYLIEQKKLLKLTYKYRNGQFQGFDYHITAKNRRERKIERQIQRFARKNPIVTPEVLKESGAGDGELFAKLTPVKKTIYGYDTIEKIDSADGKDVKVSKEVKNYNTIVVRQFGYINCDFFTASPSLTNVRVKIPDAKTQVRIFFTDYKAVAAGSNDNKTARFSNFPAGEPILMVCTREASSGMEMSLQRGYLTPEMECGEFEPFNTEKLQKFLNGSGNDITSGDTRSW